MDKITTHGRFKALTILTAKDVFPEPLEPAMPIIYGPRSAFTIFGYRLV